MTLLSWIAAAAAAIACAALLPRCIRAVRKEAALRRSARLCARAARRGICIGMVEMGEAYELRYSGRYPWLFEHDTLISIANNLRSRRRAP